MGRFGDPPGIVPAALAPSSGALLQPRWLATMKARPSWAKVNEGFYTYFVAPYAKAPFEGL